MSKHHIEVDHEKDLEHDNGLPECLVRILFVFHPYRRAYGPSYASGGEPAEPAFVEFDGAQKETNGKWLNAPEFDEWARQWLENEGYETALEQAGYDNEPDPDASMISLWSILDATTHNTRPILSYRHEIGLVRAWLKRQRTLGEAPNADALWAYIYHKWPRLLHSVCEYIFQASTQ